MDLLHYALRAHLYINARTPLLSMYGAFLHDEGTRPRA